MASAAAQPGSGAPYQPTGNIVADSGYRPDADGFNFPNYGAGNQDLTPAQMVDLFGFGVCARVNRAGCVLTPPAQVWMAKENQNMDAGHCFGFSVTSLMMYQGFLDPLRYGGPTAIALLLYGNLPLQERIAESHVLWESSKVQAGFVEGTSNHVLSTLTRALNSHQDTYTLAMYNRAQTVGHAVTPYEVENRGGGRFAVVVYDNNYPTISRAVMFDRNSDSWSYEGSTNPDERSSLYDGQGHTNPPILSPTSPGVGVQPCPFCRTPQLGPSASRGPSSLTPGEYEEVALTTDGFDHAHLTITDDSGHRTGFVNGGLVNEIPGARVIAPMAGTDYMAPEPQYRIPRNVRFTISLDGSELPVADTESVSVIGPGYSGVASNITVRPGEEQHLQLTDSGTKLSYRAGAGKAQVPHLEIGLQRPGSDYRFAVTAPPIKPGSVVTAVAEPKAKRVTVNAANVENGGTYSLAATQLSRPRNQTAGRSVHVPAGGSTHVSLKH